jgi:hypothetical protein
VADQPLKDIIVVMRDTGMRNARELYSSRRTARRSTAAGSSR